MYIENNKEEVPFFHYADLFAKADAAEMANRTGENFDGEAFSVTLLGVQYRIAYPSAVISPEAPLPKQTFLLRYLLEGKQITATAKFLTFREMPWGELYIKPYTGRVLTRAAFTFGTRLPVFEAAAEKLGGRKLSHGDAGYEFCFVGDYTMQILVWAGDEEFPPNAQILYSDNFVQGFAPEDRVVAGDILIGHIKAAM